MPRRKREPTVREILIVAGLMVAVFLLYVVGFWNFVAGLFINHVFRSMKNRLPPPKKVPADKLRS